jgi:hypothetical protein
MTVVDLYLGKASTYLQQIVGMFGWGDTPAPFIVVFAVGVAIGGMAWLAFATAKRRHWLILLGLLLASIVVPIAIDVTNALQIHNDVWASRYAMPLYMGIPLLSAAIAGRTRAIRPVPAQSMVHIVAVIVGAGQFLSFYGALRRYAVGVGGPTNLSLHGPGSWSPPLPAAVCIVGAALIAAAYGWLITRLDRVDRRDPDEVVVQAGDDRTVAGPTPTASGNH